MECPNCELKQRYMYCEQCLRTHLREKRLQIAHYATERDDHVSKAQKLLSVVSETRGRRAEVQRVQDKVEEVMGTLVRLRGDNDKKRERLRSLRDSITHRRHTLAQAHTLAPLQPQTQPAHDAASLSAALARARSGLVQELVEVFNVVEVGGRPPVGGRAGTKGEWTIGDLVLPVPGDIRRYPPDHINAVITHTIHFLRLLAFYLGIKLPFEIVWVAPPSPGSTTDHSSSNTSALGSSAETGRFGVGVPWIGAGRGGDSGSWAKYFQKHPLHLSASASSPTTATAQPQESEYLMTESYILPSSRPRTSSTPTSPSSSAHQGQPSFTTAFAMLLYNVAYLAFTQGVDVPLAQAGEALSVLWGVCCSGELGRRSHQTSGTGAALPPLPPPTPPGFGLDFAQLVQATMAPVRRGMKGNVGRESTGKDGGGGGRRREREKIVEEEEGWDLVEDA
ncbi:hypothetical protein FIBSPDRAFT_844291 [Athelia psychrophila]|uniref:Autophagy-related protein 14 n=1 Tax=Athelia psychrophila TaxID=1759441 RepID=A0A167UQZ9_9AGAM|nr:hypothetical protein FIBSPDRAFT_844291 [Fibularhizoctonia sp. CBS 109695]